jgi:hypothetical protein
MDVFTGATGQDRRDAVKRAFNAARQWADERQA